MTSMTKRTVITIEGDKQGRIFMPSDLCKQFGLTVGSKDCIDEDFNGFRFSRSSDNLALVYVEPTNMCNLDCAMCMRKVWDESLGKMDVGTFSSIMDGVKSFQPLPKIFFGGFGEPLAHPEFLEMLALAKSSGADVEIITNGILLNEKVAQKMIDIGLNRVWVSIDGATPESYADVHLGNELPRVQANLNRLQMLRGRGEQHLPRLGIAFVAMRRNIADLPKVVSLGRSVGADQFSISNVLPHTAELRDQVLYANSIYETGLQPSRWPPYISFPRMDLNKSTFEHVAELVKTRNQIQVTRQLLEMGINSCPFIEKGSVSVRWDGTVSPCLPLLHTHVSYLDDNRRTTQAYAIGNIREHSLAEMWNNPEYVKFRERLLAFDFAPCSFCNSCELAETNLDDCFGSGFPACGGRLWAQRFIQCP